MSQRTQRLANNFPIWTKIRRDPSSLGQRFFSIAADYLDFQTANLVKVKETANLFDTTLPVGDVYFAPLDTSENVVSTVGISSFVSYEYPDVLTGVDTVSRVESIEELIFSAPDELVSVETATHNQLTVWSSDSIEDYETIHIPNKLTINVVDSLTYKNADDVAFSRYSNIRLEGIDINGSVITELIQIVDDGYYQTKFIYSELIAVSWEGFDGNIFIYANDANKDFCKTKYWLGASDEVEGPLHIRLSEHEETACLEYFTIRYKEGSQYRQGESDLIDNEEHLGWQYLLDDSGQEYLPIDFAISDQNQMIYVLDDQGIVHVYDLGLKSFFAFNSGETKESNIVLDCITPYAQLNDSVKLFTRHERLRENIVGVVIKRTAPDATVRYLQADLTWGVSAYTFSQSPEADMPEGSWKDFGFTSELNAFGQWDFVLTTQTVSETQIYHTAVRVDSKNSEIDLTTGRNAYGIYFNWDGRLVLLEEDEADTTFTFFTEKSLKCYFDERDQRVWFKDLLLNLTIDTEPYAATKQQLRTYIDFLGAELGCFRFANESMSNFYKRILLEIFEPASAGDQDFKRTAGRTLGMLDQPVMKVTLLLDEDGETDAPDPYFEITSTHIRGYDDYANGTLAFEINLLDMNDGYFLHQVEAIINASDNFAAVLVGEPNDYIKSSSFRVDNTEKVVLSELLNNTSINKLKKRWIKSIRFTDFTRFQTEQSVSSDVESDGDYFIDYSNGVVMTHTPVTGFASYVYREFPLTIYSQNVRAYNLNDSDIDYKIKNTQKNHINGISVPKVIKPLGAKIYNLVYKTAPNQWGR